MTDWIQVRLKRSTRMRLRELLESQRELADNGRTELPESGRPGGGDPSVDWLINLALDRIDAHRERARRAARKKKLKGDSEKGDLAEMLDPADCIHVVPETPLEHFRAAWASLAKEARCDELDGQEYQRVYKRWILTGEIGDPAEFIITNAR